MSVERQILANLAWRLYESRHLVNKRQDYIKTSHEFLYHEAVSAMIALHNAFQQAKQIYFDNLPED